MSLPRPSTSFKYISQFDKSRKRLLCLWQTACGTMSQPLVHSDQLSWACRNESTSSSWALPATIPFNVFRQSDTHLPQHQHGMNDRRFVLLLQNPYTAWAVVVNYRDSVNRLNVGIYTCDLRSLEGSMLPNCNGIHLLHNSLVRHSWHVVFQQYLYY